MVQLPRCRGFSPHLVGVMSSLDHEMPWVQAAVPDAMTDAMASVIVMVVRLHATEEILMQLVHQREVGSGLKYQARRSVEQLRLME